MVYRFSVVVVYRFSVPTTKSLVYRFSVHNFFYQHKAHLRKTLKNHILSVRGVPFQRTTYAQGQRAMSPALERWLASCLAGGQGIPWHR